AFFDRNFQRGRKGLLSLRVPDHGDTARHAGVRHQATPILPASDIRFQTVFRDSQRHVCVDVRSTIDTYGERRRISPTAQVDAGLRRPGGFRNRPERLLAVAADEPYLAVDHHLGSIDAISAEYRGILPLPFGQSSG